MRRRLRPAKTGGRKGSGREGEDELPAAPALTLDDEQFVPYDLDYNDYATVVFSARYGRRLRV